MILSRFWYFVLALLGGAAGTDAVPLTNNFSATSGRVERSGKGGLHVIASFMNR